TRNLRGRSTKQTRLLRATHRNLRSLAHSLTQLCAGLEGGGLMNFNTAMLQDWFNTYGLKIIIAAIILVVAHFAAKAVKWSIAKGADRFPFFAGRDGAGPGGAKPMVDVGERIGEIGYWLVWLLGLMAALNEIGGEWSQSIVAPLNGMVAGFLAYLPRVV